VYDVVAKVYTRLSESKSQLQMVKCFAVDNLVVTTVSFVPGPTNPLLEVTKLCF